MIYCANNNTLYKSARDVCEDLALDRGTVSNCLAGRRKSASGYLLTNLDDLSEDGIKAARAWLLYSAYKIVLDVSPGARIYEGVRK